MAGKHISYSEWKNWSICPYYHKLTYIDKVKQFQGNIYTAFGKALHTLCEETLTKTEQYKSSEKIITLLKEEFVKELKALPAEEQQRANNDFNLREWMDKGIEIIPDLYRTLVISLESSAKTGMCSQQKRSYTNPSQNSPTPKRSLKASSIWL